jgi:hypothetical protein
MHFFLVKTFRIFLIETLLFIRGAPVEGDGDSWDFGTGAGFYVNATTPGWSKHYRYLLLAVILLLTTYGIFHSFITGNYPSTLRK